MSVGCVWMGGGFGGCFIVATPPLDLESSSVDRLDRGTDPPSLGQLRHRTRQEIRSHADAAAEDLDAERFVEATRRLTQWYGVLRGDSRFDESKVLRGTTGGVRRRLLQAEVRLRSLVKREAAGGAVGDDAARLIELIQTVVRPEFWRDSGGPGSIFYYQSKRALVIRATSDVHQDIGDLLRALR